MKTVFFLALALVGTTFSSERELQFENDFVRVWKATISPHEPLHYHRHDTGWVVVGLKGGRLDRIDDSGNTSVIAFETGKACWVESDPIDALHAEVNVEGEDIVVMVIELKSFDAPGVGYGIDFTGYTVGQR